MKIVKSRKIFLLLLVSILVFNIFAVIALHNNAYGIGIALPVLPAPTAASGGNDEGSPGCTAMGLSLNGGREKDFTNFVASDFNIEIINRGEFLITTNSPDKHFFKDASGPTLKDIIGNGCRVYDNRMDDKVRYDDPNQSMFSVQEVKSSSLSSVADQMNLINHYLGSVTTSQITSMELTWNFAYERIGAFVPNNRLFGGSSDGYYVLTTDTKTGDTKWKDVRGSDKVESQTSLIITNIKNKDLFNKSLLITGSPGNLLLTTTESSKNKIAFTETTMNGEAVFEKNPADLKEGYIGFTTGETVDSFMKATGFVNFLYYYNTRSTTKAMPIIIRGGGAIDDPQSVNLNDSSTTAEVSCESNAGTFSFMICPILKVANKTVSWLDEQIMNLLIVNPNYYNKEIPNKNGVKVPNLSYLAWARVRNISYILLVIIMLIMVIGTAIGSSFVDAYTVKRAMPRLLVAIVFMALSYDIARILIDITNAIGIGIGGFIAEPFGGIDKLQLTNIFAPPGGIGSALGTGVLAGVAIAAVGVVAITLLGSYLLVAGLVLFAGLLLLALRQMLLIFLMIFGPLAILFWIFPGHDKVWKMWWDSFYKLLLLFPVIMALIIIGRGFALIVQTTGSGGVMNTIIKLTAFVGPYFFIPSAFKMAGGAFSSLAGMAGNRVNTVRGRQKELRSKALHERGSQLLSDTRAGNLFKGGKPKGIRGRLNTLAQGTANLNRLRPTKPGSWMSQLRATGSDVSQQQRDAMEEDKDWTFKGNDAKNAAAAEATSEADLRARLQRTGQYTGPDGERNLGMDTAKITSLKRKYGDNAFRQATFLAAVKGGTAYNGASEWTQVAAGIAGNDDEILGSLVKKGREASMAAGRVDAGGAGFGHTLDIARQFRDNPNYTAEQGDKDLVHRVFEAQGPQALTYANMKPQAIKNMIPEMQDRMSQAFLSGDQDDIDRELAYTASIYDALGSSSPQIAKIFGDNVFGWRPPTAGGVAGPQQTVQELMNTARSDPNGHRVFHTTRREFTAQQAAQQAAAGGGGGGGAGGVGGVGGAGGAGGAGGGGGGAGGGAVLSDIRLKKNIQYLYTSEMGIDVYRFQYMWSEEVYVGVIAQDILNRFPQAVSIHYSKYYSVDYSLLDLDFVKYSDWVAPKQYLEQSKNVQNI